MTAKIWVFFREELQEENGVNECIEVKQRVYKRIKIGNIAHKRINRIMLENILSFQWKF